MEFKEEGNEAENQIQKPDLEGRILIGKRHANRAYIVEELGNGDILLRPVAIKLRREAWLSSNPAALASVRNGLAQSATGDVHYLGSFAGYASDCGCHFHSHSDCHCDCDCGGE